MVAATYLINSAYVVWTFATIIEVILVWWYSFKYLILNDAEAGKQFLYAFISLVFTAYAFQIAHFIVYGV